MIDKLSGEDILAMQHLRRWHMVRVRREQTLAEHSATVAMLAVKIARLWKLPLGWMDHAILFDMALAHDAHEIEYGDMPGIVKSLIPEYDEKSAKEFWEKRGKTSTTVHPDFALLEQVVKLADKLEGYLFYVLEGEDPALREANWIKVQERLKEAPREVKEFVWNLSSKVLSGQFTPQPGKARDALLVNSQYGKGDFEKEPRHYDRRSAYPKSMTPHEPDSWAKAVFHHDEPKSTYPASPDLPEKVLTHEHSPRPAHVLYKTGDKDAPPAILDRNGEVTLGLCRVCRKGEAELGDYCPGPANPYRPGGALNRQVALKDCTVVRGKLHNCQAAEEQIEYLEKAQLSNLQVEIGRWADKVFPDRTPHGTLSKLVLHEVPEFLHRLMEDKKKGGVSNFQAGEYADLVILILDIAYQTGVDVQKAVEEKMAVNRSRAWEKIEGTEIYQHVEGVVVESPVIPTGKEEKHGEEE